MENKTIKEQYTELILSGEVQEAIEFIKANVPDIYIYKYSQGKRYEVKSMFSNEGPQFWLSNLANFNDPFDGLYLKNCRSKDIYNRDDPSEVQLAYKEQQEQFEADKDSGNNQSRLYATCFSENEPTTIKMWSYYADNHKGFCSKYSLHKLIESGIILLPIVYTDKIEYLDESIPDYLLQLALIKGKEWEWENEWRIVHVADVDVQTSSGIFHKAILPEKIYCGCNDIQHVKDNHNYIREINKLINLESFNWDISNVFTDDSARISLADIEPYCRKYKVSLSVMSKSTNGYELFERKYLKYF